MQTGRKTGRGQVVERRWVVSGAVLRIRPQSIVPCIGHQIQTLLIPLYTVTEHSSCWPVALVLGQFFNQGVFVVVASSFASLQT
ncbi:hypothetical protein BaRGS_00010756 [Batillaria attramentaria]|uniref:Uncharacterized protein n=1 Tax=Batillaria attramentaria TaxID=370345 RepID=A0ABD0LEI9_9CAEN